MLRLPVLTTGEARGMAHQLLKKDISVNKCVCF